jgi:hypothetical protein
MMPSASHKLVGTAVMSKKRRHPAISKLSSCDIQAVILRLDRRIQEKMEKQYFVYILDSSRNGTLYIGIASDLIRRVWERTSELMVYEDIPCR